MENVTIEIGEHDDDFPSAKFSFKGEHMCATFVIHEPYLHPKSDWLNWIKNIESEDTDYFSLNVTVGEGIGDEKTLLAGFSKKAYGKSLINCIYKMIANPKCWRHESRNS